jgi:hypothetical protein
MALIKNCDLFSQSVDIQVVNTKPITRPSLARQITNVVDNLSECE